MLFPPPELVSILSGQPDALLFIQPVTELFDYRVGKKVPGDPLHFRLGGGFVQSTVKNKLKELSLADSGDPLITTLAQRAMDGLALRIKDGIFHHYCDKSFHGKA